MNLAACSYWRSSLALICSSSADERPRCRSNQEKTPCPASSAHSAREALQVVDVDGVLGRHDEPDLVVVEARVEGDLVRVVDVDRAVHPVDRRHVLAS